MNATINKEMILFVLIVSIIVTCFHPLQTQYARIMEFYYPLALTDNRPHILGLTASPVMTSELESSELQKMKETFCALLYNPLNHKRVLRSFAPLPAEVILIHNLSLFFLVSMGYICLFC